MIDLVSAEDIKERKKGYEKYQPKKYTRKQLIDIMQQWVKENGRNPVARDFDSYKPNRVTYTNEFGTWNNTLEAVGLKINNRSRKYSRKILIEILQKWEKDNNKIPTATDFDNMKPCRVTYTIEFGSWTNTLIAAGFYPNDIVTRGRQGEIQTLSEFKTEGAIDLSGQNRNSICDGICPKGEKFDTKSASLIFDKKYNHWGWQFIVTINQFEEVDYLFLRAYEDKDFAKSPTHKWRIPIDFMDNRRTIFICKDKKLKHNVDNMKKYEI